MNPNPSRFASWSSTFARAFLAAVLGCLGPSLSAQLLTTDQINQRVYARLHGLSDAQVADSVWQGQDADGDGQSNGQEVIAGTLYNSAPSVIRITGIAPAAEANHLALTFPTANGKHYRAQGKASLADANWTDVSDPSPAVVSLEGDGFARTLKVLGNGAFKFFRVVVSDGHSDGDPAGVGDWAKRALGLDPKNKFSNKQTDAYGEPLDDREYASGQLGLAVENLVTIATSLANSTATQPDSGAASDLGLFAVTRGGLGALLGPITVGLTRTGTAVAGQDYTALPATVSFAAGETTKTVAVNPLVPPAARKASMSVIVTLAAGSGYTVPAGNGRTATVIIYPTPKATGTGLVGTYYKTASTTYSDPANFDPLQIGLTRTDARVDFTDGSAGWGNATGPTGMVGETDGVFSVRWTGQIQPEFSELYTFYVSSNDGARLRVNGVDVIGTSNWTNNSGAFELETAGSIELKAGVKYDIILDYYSNAGSSYAGVHLRWLSPSQVKAVVPQNRLYPTSGATSAPPAITSASDAVGYLNQPFSFTVTASNLDSPIPAGTFALASGFLPAGLSLNGDTGEISGTPTVAGAYQLAITVTKAGVGSATASLALQVVDSGNGFTREVWQGIAATTNIWDIPVTTPPSISDTVNATTLQDTATTYGNNYGVRLSGFVTPPVTANYYFWLSANDSAELWISNDHEPANKVRRAIVTAGNATPRQWVANASQKSPWLSLIGGKKYYVEILHKGVTAASNHLSVAWYLDPRGNSIPTTTTTFTGEPVLPADIRTGVNAARTAIAGGCVPGFAFWKYYATPPSSAPGTLYTANMLPQVSGSQGSGSATLRVSADGTSAVLAYNFKNLTGGITARHIHNDTYQRPDGSILPSDIMFDIDTAPVLPDGSYLWDLTTDLPSSFTITDVLNIISQGKSYVNLHTALNPAGEIKGQFAKTNGTPTFTPPLAPPPLVDDGHTTDAGAARFLNQATFGSTPADVAYIKTNGYSVWLAAQFALPSTYLSPLIDRQTLNVPFPGSQMWNAWWRRAVTAPDQLRQRIAFALSEICVISDVGPLNNVATTQADYYDMLLDASFTNFRRVLKDVTLHPAQGRYLDMVNNNHGSVVTGLHANENYAREIKQLFSIGLFRLWPDGSLVTDSAGNLVPTYSQEVVTGFSDALTGWSYFQNDVGGRLPTTFPTNPSTTSGNLTWLNPMKLVPRRFELGSKLLLDNVVLPPVSGYPQLKSGYTTDNGGYLLTSLPTGSPANSGTSTTYSYLDPARPGNPAVNYNRYDVNGILSVDACLESIMSNVSVAPYICRQLIQRLVTSAPTPGYVYRVVQAFNGEKNWDGVRTNVRGDLKDVIKAILLDYEARSAAMLDPVAFPAYGKQREPVLRVTAAARFFAPAISSFDGTYTQTSAFTIDAGAVPRPVNRIRITTTNPHRLVAGNNIRLEFASNGTTTGPLPPNDSYGVTTVLDANNFLVLSRDLTQGYYDWSGSTITVYANIFGADDVGDRLWLTFMPQTNGGPAPVSGEYQVASVITTAPQRFTVTHYPGGVAGTNATNPNGTTTGSAANGPFCIIPRLTTGVSYRYTDNSTSATIDFPFAHNLSVGQFLYLDNSGVLEGRESVTTVVSPTQITITIPDPNGSTTTTGMIVYSLNAPFLDRTGGAGSPVAVAAKLHTWQMGLTDSESTTASIGQTPLRAQTVFNYFFPDYQFPGTLAALGATVPEFMLTTESATTLLGNAIQQGVLSNGTNQMSSFKNNGGAIMLDYDQTLPAGVQYAGAKLLDLTFPGGVAILVDILNKHLTGSALSTATVNQIIGFINNSSPGYFPYDGSDTSKRNRLQAIVHLILTSPDYAIQK